MDSQESELHLKKHIPYRMGAVDGLHWVCNRLLARDMPYSIDVHSQKGTILNHIGFALTNALVDAGLVHGRGLLGLLGLGLHPKELRLVVQSRRREGDVTMEHLGAVRVGVEEACTSSLAGPEEVQVALESILLSSNKGIAHHTTGPPTIPTAVQYRLGAIQATALVEKHLYVHIGIDVPSYRIWTESIQVPRDGARSEPG